MKKSEGKLLEIKSKARKRLFAKGQIFYQLKKEWEDLAILKLEETFVEDGLILVDGKLAHPIAQSNNIDTANEAIPHFREKEALLSCLKALFTGSVIKSLKRLSLNCPNCLISSIFLRISGPWLKY